MAAALTSINEYITQLTVWEEMTFTIYFIFNNFLFLGIYNVECPLAYRAAYVLLISCLQSIYLPS